MKPEKKYALLCLGDSYTIGEQVPEKESFPFQAAALLKKDGYDVGKPIVIAKTGWTTDELIDAINHWEKEHPHYFNDNTEVIVTLLIGVNNEFRGRGREEYRTQFNELLAKALFYAKGNRDHVFVLSIPDWGATPFYVNDPRHRGREQIGSDIDAFNSINKTETLKQGIDYTDITPISRLAPKDPDVVAGDGLHPSGKMYSEWVKLLVPKIEKELK